MENNNSFFIRLAIEDDINKIAQMRLRLQEYIEECNDRLWKMSDKLISGLTNNHRKHIYDKNARLVVAVCKETDEVVGMGLGRICFHDIFIPDKSGRLDDIWVDEAYRRKGICNQIVSNIMDFFVESGVKSVILDYIKGNIGSEIVWSNLGFKPILVTAVTEIDEVLVNINKDS